jgi:hypothetical protein
MVHNLLIIGGDLADRHAIAASLRTKGYTPHQVQTVAEGISALQRQTFGAVLLLERMVSDVYGREFLDIVVKSTPPMLVLTDPWEINAPEENGFIGRKAFGLMGISWDQGIPFLDAAANQPPFQRASLKEIDPRLNAAMMIHQSEKLYAKFKKYKFKFIAETAREWLRLIDAGSVSESEVGALVAMVTEGRWSGPRWIGLAHYISRWAHCLGFSGVEFDALKNCLPAEPEEKGH